MFKNCPGTGGGGGGGNGIKGVKLCFLREEQKTIGEDLPDFKMPVAVG